MCFLDDVLCDEVLSVVFHWRVPLNHLKIMSRIRDVLCEELPSVVVVESAHQLIIPSIWNLLPVRESNMFYSTLS